MEKKFLKVKARADALAQYNKRFLHNEDGSELMQAAIVILAAVVLAGILWAIVDVVSDHMNNAKTQLENMGGASGATTATTTPTAPVPPPTP